MKEINIDSFFKKAVNYLEKTINNKDIKSELRDSFGEEYLLDYINKSIDLIIFNENSYLENKYKITINILNQSNNIGNYILYLDSEGEFIDEFLVWQ
ncbi:hypothetical protein ACTS95_13425 [Empedobacter brevis]|uniref:Uncharacterized protein n=1 Tax=Empedobacter brevis NBRC 14943 = ATCC 43319 TaxID=1218108 RepID=A0A511NEY2_9FLAO|nr:hypothetical protein [Empedobacter brevis]GEM51167.1 hypothetical protein EB1_09570 [Empedobacter brevis NBRC 14943 = ATCC 43319]